MPLAGELDSIEFFISISLRGVLEFISIFIFNRVEFYVTRQQERSGERGQEVG